MGLTRVAVLVLLVLQVGTYVDSAPIVHHKGSPRIKRTSGNGVRDSGGMTVTSLSDSSVGTLTVPSTPTLLGNKYRPPIINFRYQGGPVSIVTISIPQLCVDVTSLGIYPHLLSTAKCQLLQYREVNDCSEGSVWRHGLFI
jgi:hypothetical protein